MGAWGVKINQNDVYADVRDFYTAFLKYGFSDDEALNNTLKEFKMYIEDPEDRELFWMSLAEIMWQAGRLTEKIKENAISCIEGSYELEKWYAISEKTGDERKKILEELKVKLNSEQPKIKKFRKKKYIKCNWSDGDIFRYEFKGETANQYNMLNKYLFVQKIGDYFEEDPDYRIIKSYLGESDLKYGNIFPVVHIWVTDNIDFIPSEDNKNECIATLGTKEQGGKNYSFFIFDMPEKNDSFSFISHSEILLPDVEDRAYIEENGVAPKHLTWKFFEKHVIGRYIHWTQGINIFL